MKVAMEPRFEIDDVRFRLAAARRILHRGGCDSGVAGHVSVRATGEPAFWTTPMAGFDIVHVHSRYVNVLATKQQMVGMYNVSSLVFHDDQALYVDSGDAPAREVHRILEALGHKRVLLMQHHGAIVVSGSLESVTVEALLLEEAARCHLEAQASGGSPIVDERLIRARRENPYFRKLHWETSLRRLEKSDPELFAFLRR